jgi:hypothetical protein
MYCVYSKIRVHLLVFNNLCYKIVYFTHTTNYLCLIPTINVHNVFKIMQATCVSVYM